MPKHYPLSPSGSSRWLTCPGSLALAKEHPDQMVTGGSAYSNEGDVAHELCELALVIGVPVDELTAPTLCNRCNVKVTSPPCQSCGSPEYRIDHEMLKYVRTYVDFVQGLHEQHEVLESWFERTVESTTIDDLGGTVDGALVYRDANDGRVYLHLVDLKYGAGVWVGVEGNQQLLTYLVILQEHHPNIQHFRITIIQPRMGSGEPETVDVTQDEVKFHQERIVGAVVDGQTLQEGSHCRWCPAKAICPRLAELALQAAKEAFDDAMTMPVEDIKSKWTELLAAEKQIQDMFDAIRKRMLAEMQRGEHFDGWKAVRSTGNRRWAFDEETVEKKLKQRRIGKKAAYEQRLKSPTTLEKEGFGDAIKDLVTRSDLGYRVVPESARGEAVTFETVEAMFDDDLSDLLA